MFLSGDDKIVRGKKGAGGVHIMKTVQVQYGTVRHVMTVQAVIVSVYEEPILAEQCANTTEKLGDYLVSVGF